MNINDLYYPDSNELITATIKCRKCGKRVRIIRGGKVKKGSKCSECGYSVKNPCLGAISM